jgi:hypothetical protein
VAGALGTVVAAAIWLGYGPALILLLLHVLEILGLAALFDLLIG